MPVLSGLRVTLAAGTLELVGTDLELTIRVQIPADAAQIGVEVRGVDVETTKLDLGQGDLLQPSTWRDSLGTVDLAANVDVAKLRVLFPKDSAPFDEMEGHIKIAGELRHFFGRAKRVEERLRASGSAVSVSPPRRVFLRHRAREIRFRLGGVEVFVRVPAAQPRSEDGREFARVD
jgi:hypothetical protein